MMKMTELVRSARKPACAQCGGTGYVYLWSMDLAGSSLWFCDRSRCKRFWRQGGAQIGSAANVDVRLHDLQTLVASSAQPVLQPV